MDCVLLGLGLSVDDEAVLILVRVAIPKEFLEGFSLVDGMLLLACVTLPTMPESKARSLNQSDPSLLPYFSALKYRELGSYDEPKGSGPESILLTEDGLELSFKAFEEET